jgi:hypothetical protein
MGLSALWFGVLFVVTNYLFRFKLDIEAFNHFVVFGAVDTAVILLTIGLCGYVLVVLGWGRRVP